MSRFGMTPQDFIYDVLCRYHHGHQTLTAISDFYDLPLVVIARVVDLYGFNDVNGGIMRKTPPTELADEARTVVGKITDEDLKDLEIDLNLFQKNQPDEEKP